MPFQYKFNWMLILSIVLMGCASEDVPVEKKQTSVPNVISYSKIEKAVFTHTNAARVAPKTFAQHLQGQLAYYKGMQLHLPGKSHIISTHEGAAAVQEAIQFLKTTETVPALEWSPILARAAQDHVIDTGPSGHIGHKGLDNSTPFQRIERYGKWRGTAGENIAYGKDNGLDVVKGLIIDDGVKSRGHRANIFNKKYKYVGVACGPHQKFRTLCVSVYAGEVDRK